MQNTLYERIYGVITSVFPSINGTINDYWGPEEIEEWDSMGHLNLIMALSDAFNVSFEFEEVMSIERVGDIVVMLESKGVE